MNEKHYLLDTLGIHDFICRGRGVKTLDILSSYYLTHQAINSGVSSQIKKNMQAQGLDIETLSAILEADDSMIEKMINQNTELSNNIDDDDIPQELQEQYKTNLAQATKLKEQLSKDVSANDKILLEKTLSELEIEITKIKQLALQSKITANPTQFAKNPKFMKAMLSLLTKEQTIKPVTVDENGVLFNLQEKLIEAFLIGKGFEQKAIDKILIGNDEMSFSQKDFIELCTEICKEPENGLTQESYNFFTSMRSL